MTGSAARPHGRLLARNTLLNLVGLGSPMLVALVAVPVLVTGLGTDRFGVLAIAWMLLAYLGELGFGSTTTKFTAEALGASARHETGLIAWTTALMQATLGLLEGAALYLAAPWLVERVLNMDPALWAEARTCLTLLAVALPVLGLSKSFMGVLEAAQRFDLITAIRVPATVLSYALPMLGIAVGWGLPAIFGLILVSRVVALVAYVVFAIRSFPDVSWRPAFHRAGWRPMLSFGGWTAVSSVISPLLVQLDRFVVGIAISMTAVAFYAAPFEVVARMAILPMAVVTTLFPAFSQLGGGGDWRAAGRLAARAVKVIVLLVAPLALLLIGGAADGLRLWLGAEFAERSGTAVQILAVGVLLNAAAHVPYVLLQSAGRPDIPARFHLLELPLHAGLAWVLVTHWGITGAAIAWTIRVSLDSVLLFTATHRLSLLRVGELDQERAFRLAGLTVAAGVVLVLTTAGVESAVARLSLLGAALLAAPVILWRFGIGAADRSRLLTLLRGAATP